MSIRMVFAALMLCAMSAPAAAVKVERVPDGGIQPQAVSDERGTIHLIYFKGDPAGGDVFYVRRAGTAKEFTAPIRVNSGEGGVIAAGTVRGAHLALGRRGRVHVAWMGSKAYAKQPVQAQPAASPHAHSAIHPMLYARLNDRGDAFEPQRDLMQFATGLDGGASVAADPDGNVYVAWHADAGEKGEAQRRMWVVRSRDDGRTFDRETAAWDEPTGACACCGMRAMADRRGDIYMLYRAASNKTERDITLLVSRDRGRSFQGSRLHRWNIGACPMSTAFLTSAGGAMLAAWETEWQVYFAELDGVRAKASEPVVAPGSTGKRKHPVVARNQQGETLLAWTEGMAFRRGGSLAWQLYDRSGRPVSSEKGEADGVPVSSLAAAVSAPGGFIVFY